MGLGAIGSYHARHLVDVFCITRSMAPAVERTALEAPPPKSITPAAERTPFKAPPPDPFQKDAISRSSRKRAHRVTSCVEMPRPFADARDSMRIHSSCAIELRVLRLLRSF